MKEMRFRIWPLVTFAFSVLFLLVGLSSWAIFYKTEEINNKTRRVQWTYQQTDDALTEIRSGVYRASLLIRELIFESGSVRDVFKRAKFADIQSQTWFQVHRLEASLGTEQRARFEELRTKLATYWQSNRQVLDQEAHGSAGARELLEQRALDRERVLNLADEMDALNEANVHRQEKELTQDQREFKRFLERATTAVLAGGGIIFLLTVLHLSRLERRSEAQSQQLESAESELRRLSQELVRAQEEERRHISRELHDEVGQMLTGLRMELGSLAQCVRPSSEIFEQRLSSIKSLVEDSLRSVRTISLLLRPSMLDDLGLGAAVRWQAKEFSRRSSTPIAVEIDGNLSSVPEVQRTCLYRITQEALTNCARHSEATQVSIKICEKGQVISLTVQDNGKGFEPRKSGRRGLGLLGMEERVRGLQGSMSVSSQPGRGTAVHVHLPLPAELRSVEQARTQIA